MHLFGNYNVCRVECRRFRRRQSPWEARKTPKMEHGDDATVHLTDLTAATNFKVEFPTTKAAFIKAVGGMY